MLQGAHEDWSRLARLSFDGPKEEFELSQHAVGLVKLVDEVRSYQSGAPVVPITPGMLWIASPGTPMAKALEHGESFGVEEFVRRRPEELEALYPGNSFSGLPPDTLCWTHPDGLCVSPIELADTARNTAKAYGVETMHGRATVDVCPGDDSMVRVTIESGEDAGRMIDTPRAYLFAGAQSKEVLSKAAARDSANEALQVEEFHDTYITGISTVRYKHANHPSSPAAGSGHVVMPITLGQLEIPNLTGGFQANFSVVAEEGGDVYKCRLSGSVGSEVIETVSGMHDLGTLEDSSMAGVYDNVFGTLFPHLKSKPLDFNRCVTYRNYGPAFSGTSLVEKTTPGGASLMTSVGCFGVGVKFGPALGQAAAAHAHGDEVELGMKVYTSGNIEWSAEGMDENLLAYRQENFKKENHGKENARGYVTSAPRLDAAWTTPGRRSSSHAASLGVDQMHIYKPSGMFEETRRINKQLEGMRQVPEAPAVGSAAATLLAEQRLFEAVGNTPLVPLSTDMNESSNMFAKLEGYNPSGSLKDRSIGNVVLAFLKQGELRPTALGGHSSLCLVTSGSAGISLMMMHKRLIEGSAGSQASTADALVVMPAAYAHKEAPAEIIKLPGMRVFYSEQDLMEDIKHAADGCTSGDGTGVQRVLLLEGVFIDVLATAKDMAERNSWAFVDQHRDRNTMLSHEATAKELMAQLPGVTDVVCGTGTGATAAGLREFLPESVIVHARPGESGKIDGLSDVRRYNNFCDTSKLHNYDSCIFAQSDANKHLALIKEDNGVIAGPSTGAVYWLAKQIAAEKDRQVVVISSDGVLSKDLPENESAEERMQREQLTLSCSGCGERVNGAEAAVFKCSSSASMPAIDHVLVPPPAAAELAHPDAVLASMDTHPNENPFVRYRSLLYSHRAALARGMSDGEYVRMVREFDDNVAANDGGKGFRETPLLWSPELNCFAKDETDNVAQSHKARHLANVMIYMLAMRQTEAAAARPAAQPLGERRLVVASCGNAGLAAATCAAAAGWPIDVCIPPTADDAVKQRLEELGASVLVCERGAGKTVTSALGRVPTDGAADPTLAAARFLVEEHGSLPLSVQGPECGLAVEGGQTMAWEILTALRRDHPDVEQLGDMMVQVGGGALGAGLAQGMQRAVRGGELLLQPLRSVPSLHTVQAEGCQPLVRAFDALCLDGCGPKEASLRKGDFMQAWSDPHSVAHGILDDETYEWVALCKAMVGTEGRAHVVSDDFIEQARTLAYNDLGVNVCHTGAAGLAGLLSRDLAGQTAPNLVVLSGLDRARAAMLH